MVVMVIVNDTSTLNGALTELGELMAQNLTTQGLIGVSASDGLTTLANDILLIQGGGSETILWQPSLDGTDSISDWGGSGHSYTVSNSILTARNVQFDEYWDNSIDWELTFEMKSDTNSGVEIVETTQTNSDRYCIQILEDGHLFFNYMPTTSRTFQKISTETSTSNYVPIKVRKESGTYYWYLNGTLIDSVAVNDNWGNVRMAFHSWTSNHFANVKNIVVKTIGSGSDCSQYQTEIENAIEYINGSGS